MKKTLTFLGTSAADFKLLAKTDCADRFDKNARRASCAMIGDSILIDCGMHVLDSIRIAKVDVSKITDIFVTHFHADHFDGEHAEVIAQGKTTPVRLWCRSDAKVPELKNIEIIRMEEGVYYHVANGLNAMSIRANHDETVFPNHFLFDVDGTKVLYATDGAWITNSATRNLRGKNIDVYVVDATCGDYEGDRRAGEHNSIPMLRLLLPSLKTLEIINDKTKVFLTHIAPSLHKTHEETQEIVQKDGMTVAHDGLTIDL